MSLNRAAVGVVFSDRKGGQFSSVMLSTDSMTLNVSPVFVPVFLVVHLFNPDRADLGDGFRAG